MGARIGGENEILRNLLVDTGRRIGALDDLKDAFGKLVDPISKTLRTLEQEKSENVSLRGTLNEVRQSYETGTPIRWNLVNSIPQFVFFNQEFSCLQFYYHTFIYQYV